MHTGDTWALGTGRRKRAATPPSRGQPDRPRTRVRRIGAPRGAGQPAEQVGRLAVAAWRRRVLSQEGSDMSSFLGPGSSVRREDLTDDAFFGDLSELGWKGKYKYDDPEVAQFRVRPRLQPGVF